MSTLDRLRTALADRYTIERELGAGGMATVYLARDLKHERQVAIKVLKPELAAVLGADRFVVEIKTTAALQHPHILPLFDSGSADSFLFYVMPYIEGETLRAKLDRETQFGVDEAIRITRDVADALDYAHRHGVVHRDIKPENILLHDGRPMVADFGIALALSAAAGGRMTETGMSLGTPHYMSPEQATADKEISGRSDIYSLGSVLYEMLTGNPPHTGSSAQQIIMKIIAETVEPVTKYRKAVPPHVAAAVAKSLEKLPADRFDTARAFAEALGNPAFTTMHASGGGYTARSRTLPRWAMPVLAVVLLAAGVGIGALLSRRTLPPPQVVRFPFALAPGEVLFTAPNIDAPFAVSPDGTRIAYAAFDSGATEATVHVRALDQLTAASLPGTEGAFNVFWSPDGKSIGFLTLTRTIGKVSAAGGPANRIAEDVDRSSGVPSWDDNHGIVFIRDGRAFRVSEGGGTPTPLVDTLAYAVGALAPTVLPGGRGVLLSVCATVASVGCERALAVADLKADTVVHLVNGAARGWYLPSGHLVYGTTDGSLFAVGFDLGSLAVTGEPVAVLEGVQLSLGNRLPHATVSASGTLTYLPLRGSGRRQLVLRGRGGGEELILETEAELTHPRLSPDGRRILLGQPDAKGTTQVWIHDRASTTTRQLTFEGFSVRPAWSPDGRRVAYSSGQAGKPYRIWSAPADGSAPGAPIGTGAEVLGATTIDWTRDGAWLVVDGPPSEGSGPGYEDIYALPAPGREGTRQRVVATSADEESGVVSPDGKWVAYLSDDSGRHQLYVQPFLVPGGRTLVSQGPAVEPAWLSDNELAYISADRDSLVVARLAFGGELTVTRTTLFDVADYARGGVADRQYDVTPGGTAFLFIKLPKDRGRSEPRVVLNWMDEVQRLVAAAGGK